MPTKAEMKFYAKRRLRIIKMRDDKGMTFSAIGEKLGGLSKQRIKQIYDGWVKK